MRSLIRVLAVGVAAGAAAVAAWFVSRKVREAGEEEPAQPRATDGPPPGGTPVTDAPAEPPAAEARDAADLDGPDLAVPDAEAEDDDDAPTETPPGVEGPQEPDVDAVAEEAASEGDEDEAADEAAGSDEDEPADEAGGDDADAGAEASAPGPDLTVLEGTIADLKTALESGSLDDHLKAVHDAEVAGKDRKGALAAIAARRDHLGEGG